MKPIIFRVIGEPKAQPRPRAFARKMGNGTYAARVYDAGTAEGFKSAIAAAAHPSLPRTPLDGPIMLAVTYVMPRPKSHYRTGKHSGELKPSAPSWHTQKPDRDNLNKALMDALTNIGMWRDDSQVCCGPTEKVYAEPGEQVGAVVRIEALGAEVAA